MSGDQNKGVLDDVPIIKNDQEEPKITPIDAQHTTLEGFLRQSIVDKYTPDTQKNINSFQGVVMRVVNKPQNFNYSTRTEVETKTNANKVPNEKYKIFLIGGPDNHLKERPKTFDGNAQDRRDIDALDDYSKSPNFNGSLTVGSIVWISQQNYRDKIIEYSFSPTVQTAAPPASPNAPPPPSAAKFNTPLPTSPQSPPAPPQLSKKNSPIKPLVNSEPCKKDPKKYEEVIDQFSVDNNPRYVPDGNTYCNIFAWDVAVGMSIKNYPHFVSAKKQTMKGVNLELDQPVNNNGSIEFPPDYKVTNSPIIELNANYTYLWFNRNGNTDKYGWKIISDPKEAQDTANQGCYVAAIWYNPDPKVRSNGTIRKAIGHVVVIRPNQEAYDPKRGPYMAQAGGRCFNKQYMSWLGEEWVKYIYVTPKC